MQVFKFGGVSIEDKAAIINVGRIIEDHSNEGLVVIISAKGKTTNALEEIIALANIDIIKAQKAFDYLIEDHLNLGISLGISSNDFRSTIEAFRSQGHQRIVGSNTSEPKYYDRVVAFGELLSSLIIYHYLNEVRNHNAKWLDIRKILKTDNNHTEAKVLWDKTAEQLHNNSKTFEASSHVITQGFIGSTVDGETTTLGREGSDFSASILAYLLDLDQLTIWKDVEGILTGDPEIFENVKLIPRISYREAIEMTYYGAKVIHPKTIKPLQNKGILLNVRSFKHPKQKGTIIGPEEGSIQYPPIVVVATNQALIRFGTLDFSFIAEEHLSEIFETFDRYGIKVNMMRNGAISFSVCIVDKSDQVEKMIMELKSNYQISKEDNLELITIRHPNQQLIEHLEMNRLVLFKESISETVRIVTKPIEMITRKRSDQESILLDTRGCQLKGKMRINTDYDFNISRQNGQISSL